MLFRSTVAVNAAQNAGILAAQIIGCQQPDLLKKISEFKNELKDKVMSAERKMKHIKR